MSLNRHVKEEFLPDESGDDDNDETNQPLSKLLETKGRLDFS